MSKGLAPIGDDGYKVVLHHINGRYGDDLYNVVAMTRTNHIKYHQTYGYHFNLFWFITKW